MQALALFGVDKDDAGVAILIAPLALLLITIAKETFSGSDENQPIHLG